MTSTQVDNTENSVVATVDTMNSSVVIQAPLIRTIFALLLPLFLFGCVYHLTSPDPEGVSERQFAAVFRASDNIIKAEVVDDGAKKMKTSYLEIAQSVMRAYPNICIETPDAISCLARRTVLIFGYSVSSSAPVLDGTTTAGFVVYKNGKRCVFEELQDRDDERRRFFEDSSMQVFSSDAGLKWREVRRHRHPIYDAATLLENCNQAF